MTYPAAYPIGFKLRAKHIEQDMQFVLDARAVHIILVSAGCLPAQCGRSTVPLPKNRFDAYPSARQDFLMCMNRHQDTKTGK